MDKRFFIDRKNYKIGDNVIIEGEEHKHLSLVLRLKSGDTIDCLPNDDNIVKAHIISMDKNKTTAIVYSISHSPNSVKNVDVFVGNLKGDKNEFLIQKLSELGANKITFFESKFVTAKIVKDKNDRFEKIALTSAKQCKRNSSILTGKGLSFNELLTELKSYDKVLVAYENEDNKSIKDVKLNKDQKIALVIGSEGGFCNEEINKLSSLKADILSLGTRILKAETAVIVFSTITMFCLGELE